VVIFAGVISLTSIRTHFRRGRWLSTFFIVAFVVSVIQNWYTLYLVGLLVRGMPSAIHRSLLGSASESRRSSDEETAETLPRPFDGLLRYGQSQARPIRADTRR
jgi:hypothetical protein